MLGPSKVKLPEWAQRISKLRETLNVTQTGLAERLRVSPMSVSRWERGTQEPSSEILILLGNMSAEPDNWYFWRTAGLSPRAINDLKTRSRPLQPRLLPATNSSVGKAARKSSLIPVPLLNVSVGTEGAASKQLAGEVESMLAAPKAWCPNPANTVCVHLIGDLMSPTIADGSVVAVDTAVNDPAMLRQKIVVAQRPGSGLLIGRLVEHNGSPSLIGDNSRYPAIPFANGMAIGGTVLWWISFAK